MSPVSTITVRVLLEYTTVNIPHGAWTRTVHFWDQMYGGLADLLLSYFSHISTPYHGDHYPTLLDSAQSTSDVNNLFVTTLLIIQLRAAVLCCWAVV
jgi:hypothetical protein